MHAEKDLDRKIRGLHRENKKSKQRSESRVKRISFSGNPNGGSEREEGANMNKRVVHSDGESQPEKRSRSEKSGGAKAYDSLPTKTYENTKTKMDSKPDI